MNKNQLKIILFQLFLVYLLKLKNRQKTGNVYTTMTLHFKNGLEIRYFVDPKDKFGLKDAISRISPSDRIDNFLNED